MLDDDSRIDRMLRDAGEQWRAQAPSAANVDERLFRRAPNRWPTVWRLASAGVAVFALFVVVLQIASRAPLAPAASGLILAQATASPDAVSPSPAVQASRTPEPTGEPPDEIVVNGDKVIATGYLLQRVGSEPTLCRLALAVGLPGSTGVCVTPSVEVVGLDAPQRELFGEHVAVVGVWNSGALVADSVSRAEIPNPRPTPAVTCSEPPGGWPGNGTVLEAEEAAGRIMDYISARPDIYAGMWSAEIPGQRERAFVVATVSEPEAVQPDLRAIFGGNLCIEQVEFSWRQLNSAADRLQSGQESWEVNVDPVINRVTVHVPALDGPTADDLRGDRGLVVVQPLVQRVR